MQTSWWWWWWLSDKTDWGANKVAVETKFAGPDIIDRFLAY